MSRWISQFFWNLNSSKNFTYPSGKLITEFTNPIAKSTSPGLSDTTFFTRWTLNSNRTNHKPLKKKPIKNDYICPCQPPPQALRFPHGRGERETSDWWWTAREHGKGTDGRRSACQILCRFLGKKSFSWHGPVLGLFKSWKRSILVAYCCKHCKLWVDRWMAQNFKTWGRNNRQAAKESDSAGFLRIEDL